MSQEDEKFLTEVFAQLTDEATEDSKRRELVSQTFTKSSGQMLFVVKCRCGQYCNVRFHCCENKMYSVTDLVIWINCVSGMHLIFARVKYSLTDYYNFVNNIHSTMLGLTDSVIVNHLFYWSMQLLFVPPKASH